MTDYKADFGMSDVIYHYYRRLIYPFKEHEWFGYCDECNKFSRNLETACVGADMDGDENGPIAVPEWGKVCQKCLPKFLQE